MQYCCYVHAVLLLCTCSTVCFVHAVLLLCTCSTVVMYMQYCCYVHAVLLLCTCSTVVMYMQYCCCVHAVLLLCTCSTEATLIKGWVPNQKELPLPYTYTPMVFPCNLPGSEGGGQGDSGRLQFQNLPEGGSEGGGPRGVKESKKQESSRGEGRRFLLLAFSPPSPPSRL